MRKISFLVIALFFVVSVQAQTASVSGTIKDASGQAFIGGTYSITFKPVTGNPGPYYQQGTTSPFTEKFSGSLDSTGSFSGVTLQRNDYINIAGTLWTFQVCSLASSQCYTIDLNLSASSVNVSSLIVPPSIAVTPGFIPSAYSDSEIIPGRINSLYNNTTDSTIHYCAEGTTFNCTLWGSAANASGGTLSNTTLDGTTTVKGPFEAGSGGELSGTWPNAGTIAGGAVNPQSLGATLYAEQFPGADVGAQVNAAEAACPTTGCVIDATAITGPHTISTPIVITEPTVLKLGYTQWDCSTVTLPCIDFQSSGSALEGPVPIGSGPVANGYAAIRYENDPSVAGAVVLFQSGASSQIAYSRIENLSIYLIETGLEAPGSVPELDGIEIVNPVGFDIRNIFAHHDSLNYTPRVATNDSTVALKLTTSYSGAVPPPGLVRIVNFWDTNDDANGASKAVSGNNSVGIWVTHGSGDDPLTSISVGGACNIEDVEYGMRFDGATESSVDNGCFFQTFPYGIYLEGAQGNTFSQLRANLNGASGNQAYYVDGTSFDNAFIGTDFYGAISGQTVYGTDNGTRTTWLASSTGDVSLPYIAGPIAGAAATSGANVNSSAPLFAGNYWNGSGSAACSVSEQLQFGSGTNPATTFSFAPSGCPSAYPIYKWAGDELQLWSTGGTESWAAINNGYTQQTADPRFDVDSLVSPTKYFALTGAPTAERTWTFPDRSDTVAGASQLPLDGSVTITASGTALAAVTGTASIAGATTSMACVASAEGTRDPDAFPSQCSVSSAGTVTVEVTTRVTDASPGAIVYAIRVIQ